MIELGLQFIVIFLVRLQRAQKCIRNAFFRKEIILSMHSDWLRNIWHLSRPASDPATNNTQMRLETPWLLITIAYVTESSPSGQFNFDEESKHHVVVADRVSMPVDAIALADNFINWGGNDIIMSAAAGASLVVSVLSDASREWITEHNFHDKITRVKSTLAEINMKTQTVRNFSWMTWHARIWYLYILIRLSSSIRIFNPMWQVSIIIVSLWIFVLFISLCRLHFLYFCYHWVNYFGQIRQVPSTTTRPACPPSEVTW